MATTDLWLPSQLQTTATITCHSIVMSLYQP